MQKLVAIVTTGFLLSNSTGAYLTASAETQSNRDNLIDVKKYVLQLPSTQSSPLNVYSAILYKQAVLYPQAEPTITEKPIELNQEITYDSPVIFSISEYKGLGKLTHISLDVEATYSAEAGTPIVSGEIGFTTTTSAENYWGQIFYVAVGETGTTKTTSVEVDVPEKYQDTVAYDIMRITSSWSSGTNIKIKSVNLTFQNGETVTTSQSVNTDVTTQTTIYTEPTVTTTPNTATDDTTTTVTTTPTPTTTTTVTTTTTPTPTTTTTVTTTTTPTPTTTTTVTTTTTPTPTTTTKVTTTTPAVTLIKNVQNVQQMPELPTGCEAAGLTIALNFYGFNVSKMDVATKYMPTMGFYYQNGVRYGADFRTTFAGDPTRSDGYGCYAPCLVTTANRYFADIGSSAKGIDISGTSLKSLFNYVAQGTPVVLISTPNLATPYLGSSWYTPSGEYLTWQSNHHCLVLIGYDYNANTVTVANPGTKYSPSVYNMDTFERIYNLKGKSAMIISTGDSSYIPNVNPFSIGDKVLYSGTAYSTSYGTGNTVEVAEGIYTITDVVADTTRKYGLLINNIGWVSKDAVKLVSSSSISAGQVYRIKNVGTGKYLNVHMGYDINTTNVYQWTGDGSLEQTFKIRNSSQSGSFLIGAMCSSNGTDKVLDIVKTNGDVVSGDNVEIYSAVDAEAQEWIFVALSNGAFKIVPTSNQNVALTAYGSGNGTASSTSPTSEGNVIVSSYAGSANQQWYLELQ